MSDTARSTVTALVGGLILAAIFGALLVAATYGVSTLLAALFDLRGIPSTGNWIGRL